MSEFQEDQRGGISKGAFVRYTIQQDPWRNERKSKFKAIGIELCRTLGSESEAAKEGRLPNSHKNNGGADKKVLDCRKKKLNKSRRDFLRSLSSKESKDTTHSKRTENAKSQPPKKGNGLGMGDAIETTSAITTPRITLDVSSTVAMGFRETADSPRITRP